MMQTSMRRSVDSSGRFQSLWGPVLPVEVEQPLESPLAISIEDAYRKGFADGQVSAEATFAELIQRERQSILGELQRSQEARHMEAIQALSDRVAEEISAVGAQIGEALAKAVCPLVSQHLTNVAHDELMRAVSRIVEVKGLVTVAVGGPEPLVQGLANQLEARGLKVTREPRDEPDLVVSVEEVELRSSLPQWLSRLEAMFR